MFVDALLTFHRDLRESKPYGGRSPDCSKSFERVRAILLIRSQPHALSSLYLIHLCRPYIESLSRSVTYRTSSSSTGTLCTRVRGCLAGPGSSTTSKSSGFSSHSRILSAQSTTASFRSFLGHANPWTRIHASSGSEFVAYSQSSNSLP